MLGRTTSGEHRMIMFAVVTPVSMIRSGVGAPNGYTQIVAVEAQLMLAYLVEEGAVSQFWITEAVRVAADWACHFRSTVQHAPHEKMGRAVTHSVQYQQNEGAARKRAMQILSQFARQMEEGERTRGVLASWGVGLHQLKQWLAYKSSPVSVGQWNAACGFH